MQRNYGSQKTKKTPTSTPFKSPGRLNFSVNISTINNNSEETNSPLISNTKELSSQDRMDYAYNMYLLACSTTKMQESVLSQMTAQNEDKRLALLKEIEKKRSYLASLAECELEVKNLSEQTHLLKKQKAMLADSLDELAVKLEKLDILKSSIQLGLPVKGFKSETDMCGLKDALSRMKKNFDLIEPVKQDLCSEAAKSLEKIEKNLLNLTELQKRCETTSAELKSAVIEKSALSVLKNHKNAN